MNTTSSAHPTVNARKLLLPYALGLIGAVTALQVLIALLGGEITVLAGILTAVIAVAIAVWLWMHRSQLAHVRFGKVVAHAIAFAAVTTSFNLHVVIQAIASQPEGFDAFARHLLTTPWFGATLGMSAFWGLGLLIHLVGSILGRGWDD